MSEIASTPPATAKREALDGVARVLGMLAAGLQTQGDAAREVALLAVRAEQLAAQAWQFSKDRDPSGAVAADLATEVALFIADASVMSQRASAEAAATRDVTAALDHQAWRAGFDAQKLSLFGIEQHRAQALQRAHRTAASLLERPIERFAHHLL